MYMQFSPQLQFSTIKKLALTALVSVTLSACGGSDDNDTDGGNASSSSSSSTSSSSTSSSSSSTSSSSSSSSSSSGAVGNVVELFEHCDYGGWSISLSLGDYNAADIVAAGGKNNDASSIKIAAGYEALLYEHDAMVGAGIKLSGDTQCLNSYKLNDQLSSIVVKPISEPQPDNSSAACIYDLESYNGGRLCLSPGEFDFASAWNNKASSVSISPGYQLELFADSSRQGSVVTLTENTRNLAANSFDNSASSYRLSRIENPCHASDDCDLTADVQAVTVQNKSGGAARKGDEAVIEFTVKNNSDKSGWIQLTPYLTSQRFSNYSNVELTTVYAQLNAGGDTLVSVELPPFIHDLSTHKRYAVGHGNYQINKVKITNANGNISEDSDYAGKDFTVSKTNAVLPIVVYDAEYFSKMSYTNTPETYIHEVFTRPAELYNEDNDLFTYYDGGFDEMMDIRHESHPIPGFVIIPEGGGTCEQATAYVEQAIGMSAGSWGGGSVATHMHHHGFDYAIALSDDQGGGVACGWIDVQVSGYIGDDPDRLQIVAVHESGHLFGAPHCDPIQGYVMCSGEKHEHYAQDGTFVWHQISRDKLSNRFD
ncbi:Development-specific protein S [Thalassocella blandensis]|nr:Development-specific protein S [Thalassocella blandensis]